MAGRGKLKIRHSMGASKGLMCANFGDNQLRSRNFRGQK